MVAPTGPFYAECETGTDRPATQTGSEKGKSMNLNNHLSLTAVVVAGAVAGVGAIVGTATAATNPVTYAACESSFGGILYHVTANGTPYCFRRDRTISWGEQGPPGLPGTNGSTVLNGTGAPASSTGQPGDFYLDTAADTLYGPKTTTGWPSTGTSLVGKPGPQGPTGPAGAGATYTTASGTTGPTPATNGAYFVDVEFLVQNLTTTSLLQGRCAVGASNPQSGIGSSFTSPLLVSEGSAETASISGVLAPGAQGLPLQLTCGVADLAATPIPISDVQWWVTPIQTTTAAQ